MKCKCTNGNADELEIRMLAIDGVGVPKTLANNAYEPVNKFQSDEPT